MPITYLRDLVEQAHWIVIGEVVTIEDRPDILDQFGFPVKIAKIKPYKFFKGAQESEFSFKFNDLWADQAVFALNESYLLFIEKAAKGPHVGYLGTLKITNDTVSTWEIWG